jgi:D-serine deaminase-like pyridoxal phosphate-dependent protein
MHTELDTPFLMVDSEVLETNLSSMASLAAARGMALRPHAKTHKCVELARRQVELGAVGLTVATVGEAEVFASAGITDLFVAYPIWASELRAARLEALAERVRLGVGVGSVEGALALGRALGRHRLEVLVEIDSGHHRTGVVPELAGEVALAAADVGLEVTGVFTFPGHGYGPGRQTQAAVDEAQALAQAASSVRDCGLDISVISGGSTPTASWAQAGVLTELRPGVYVFNDAQQVELGSADWASVALTAAATVVGVRGLHVVLDAGSKVLGADQPTWASGGGRLPDHPDARVVALSEHHATVAFPETSGVPGIGERVRVVPNHVCAAVNLADELVVTREGRIVDRWKVLARGHNS